MTKKDILEKYRDDSKFPNLTAVVFYRKDCLDAMDEFAKQQAIAFSEWMAGSSWVKHPDVEDIWYLHFGDFNEQPEEKTTAQLYTLFLEHQSKQNKNESAANDH